MLELSGIEKRLGRATVIRNLSLEVRAGERVVIAGPNGAGKSTLLRIIAGVISPDRGSIRWNGADLVGLHRRQLGYVPEGADPPGELTVAELLNLVRATKGCEPISRSIVERLDLDGLVNARICELSLGQRRRACLAAALTGNPPLLLLDEPTNGLDAAAISELGGLIDENDSHTVLLVTHDSGFAERVSTRRLTMVEGQWKSSGA